MALNKLRNISSRTRHTYIAEFVRYDTKQSFNGPPVATVLLRNIRNDTDDIVLDYMRHTVTKNFKGLKLKEGDIIQFEARVTAKEVKRNDYKYNRYERHYKMPKFTYTLSYLTNVKLTERI